jgi:hypothetical protein
LFKPFVLPTSPLGGRPAHDHRRVLDFQLLDYSHGRFMA